MLTFSCRVQYFEGGRDEVAAAYVQFLRPARARDGGIERRHVPVRKRDALLLTLAIHTSSAVMNSRDLIGGNNFYHFQPLLKMYDYLVMTGISDDEDIKQLKQFVKELRRSHVMSGAQHHELVERRLLGVYRAEQQVKAQKKELREQQRAFNDLKRKFNSLLEVCELTI